MRVLAHWSLTCIIACGAITSACAATDRSNEVQWVQVPITDLSAVSGKWDGLIRQVPHQRRDDWVTVAIAPDGRYEFSSLRTIGVFSGSGRFALDEGKLLSRSDRGTVEAVLFEAGAQRMIKAKGRAADGTEYTAEVKPVK